MSTTKTQVEEKVENPARAAKVRQYSPEVDIFSDSVNLYVNANIPGADENSVEVSIEQNILTISAKNLISENGNFELKYSEYTPGNYKRSFQINESIDTDHIKAIVKNGVLSLTIPINQPIVKKISIIAD